MAYSNNDFVKNYTQINTVPAIVGILFATASAVQFLDASISLGLLDYTFNSDHALIMSLIALVVAFAASDTKSFQAYSREEQGAVALAVVLMVGAEYIDFVTDFMANNQPVAGVAAFLISLIAWGILAR